MIEHPEPEGGGLPGRRLVLDRLAQGVTPHPVDADRAQLGVARQEVEDGDADLDRPHRPCPVGRTARPDRDGVRRDVGTGPTHPRPAPSRPTVAGSPPPSQGTGARARGSTRACFISPHDCPRHCQYRYMTRRSVRRSGSASRAPRRPRRSAARSGRSGSASRRVARRRPGRAATSPRPGARTGGQRVAHRHRHLLAQEDVEEDEPEQPDPQQPDAGGWDRGEPEAGPCRPQAGRRAARARRRRATRSQRHRPDHPAVVEVLVERRHPPQLDRHGRRRVRSLVGDTTASRSADCSAWASSTSSRWRLIQRRHSNGSRPNVCWSISTGRRTP